MKVYAAKFFLAGPTKTAYIISMDGIPAKRIDGMIETADADACIIEKLHKAEHDKARIVFARGGQAVAAIVPIEDFYLLEAMEDVADSRLANEALAAWETAGRPTGISLANLARELDIGLDK